MVCFCWLLFPVAIRTDCLQTPYKHSSINQMAAGLRLPRSSHGFFSFLHLFKHTFCNNFKQVEGPGVLQTFTMHLSCKVLIYLIVIPWPLGICLIYMPTPSDLQPSGLDIYIRQIPSGHGISNIYHSGMLT